MFNQDTCCTVAPYFEVPVENLRAFKALGQQFATKARSESGCMYYTFSFSGTTAHCREGYITAEAILAHLENVSELLEKSPQDLQDYSTGDPRTGRRVGEAEESSGILEPAFLRLGRGYSPQRHLKNTPAKPIQLRP